MMIMVAKKTTVAPNTVTMAVAMTTMKRLKDKDGGHDNEEAQAEDNDGGHDNEEAEDKDGEDGKE